MPTEFNISLLLPSRGRSTTLERSIKSLIDTADSPEQLQFILGFDDDDQESSQYFIDNIVPIIEQSGASYMVLEFKPMGYGALNLYLNKMALHAQAPWWVFWNDDAVMLDSGWDTVISSETKFCIQAFETHNHHPYSIFPIVPRQWFEQLGHLSEHQLNDAYISQIAWMLDIMVRIPIRVEHERFDLTGKNQDDTFKNRVIFEGNIYDPRDFNYVAQRQNRYRDADKISKYLSEQGYDMSHWNEVRMGRRDPWTKMLASDINNHMKRIQ